VERRTPASRGLVVVGASLAGLRVVQAARRSGYGEPIVLLGKEEHLPYDRPPLSKEFLTEGRAPAYYLTEEELRDDLAIDLRLGETATGLDTTAKTVVTQAGSIPFDRLIIATGATPRQLAHLPKRQGVRLLRTLDDAREIRRTVKAGSHVLVIGGGFIGAEIASSAAKLGASVTIVEAAPVPLVRAVGETVGGALAGLHERNGTRLVCGAQVERVPGTEHVTGAVLSTGEVIDADVIIVGIGAAPATGWLIGSGVALSPADGGVLCDEYLRTSVAGVYAAGDVVHWPNGVFGATMRLENWTNASDQGTQAAINALFPDKARPYETVPYFWSDWYGNRIQFVGTADAAEVCFASGGPDADKFLALYRDGNRLVGAATLNEPRLIMKYRRLIANRGSWQEALDLLNSVRSPGSLKPEALVSTRKMSSP
jgi:NADPH-dependent 2,4-dienoyl-CoA reductase/sulfur reductase-like enzyme